MPTKIDPSQVQWDSPKWDGEDAEEQQEERTWGGALAEGATNIPSSAGKMVKDITYPFTNWDEFSGGMKKLFSGDDEALSSVKQMLVDRYGSEDALKNTLATDPVGLLSDLSLLATGGGLAVKGAGTLGKVGALKSAGGAIMKGASAIDPISIAAQAAGGTVRGIGAVAPKLSPESLYMSALKKGALSSKTTAEEMAAAARTGLKYDIPLSMSGGGKVQSLLGTIDNQIGAFIDAKAAAGDTVKRSDVLRELNKMRQPDGLLYNTPYRDKVGKITKRTEDWVVANYPEEIPVKVAQSMKTQMQQYLSKQYGSETKAIQVASDKGYARGARLALAEKYPELDLLNMTAKELHEFEKIFDPALARVMARDVSGLGPAMKTGSGAMLDQVLGTGGVMAAVGAGQSILDTPAVKAWVARRLYKLREASPTQRKAVPYAVRETSRQLGRTSEATSEDY